MSFKDSVEDLEATVLPILSPRAAESITINRVSNKVTDYPQDQQAEAEAEEEEEEEEEEETFIFEEEVAKE
jgi:hypothetical protein